MIRGTKKPMPKLRKAPQPTLSYRWGGPTSSDRAGEATALRERVHQAKVEIPEIGSRVWATSESPTGEIGTVERANEKRTQSSSGMMTVARGPASNHSRKVKR